MQPSLLNRHLWLHDIFEVNGYESLYVGGCVRDILMGRADQIKDWDVATNAKPQTVKRIFEEAGFKVISTGEGFGGVTVVGPGGERVEVTSYRLDHAHSDGRRPDSISFASTFEQDSARRDFSANSLGLSPWTGEVIDFYGGQEDIKNQILRCVGDPATRFREDTLRAVRAARFTSQLGFTIQPLTLRAMKNVDLSNLPPERLHGEIMNAMGGAYPARFFEVLQATGLLDQIVPELEDLVDMKQNKKWHRWDVFTHSMVTLKAISGMTTDPVLRWIGAIHDIGKFPTAKINIGGENHGEVSFLEHESVGADMARTLMERLKFSTADTDRARLLIEHHLLPYGGPHNGKWSNGTIRRWVAKLGGEWDSLLILRNADLIGHGTDVTEKQRLLVELQRRVEDLKKQGLDTPPKLAIDGHDIMRLLGVEAGRAVGEAQKRLREAVTDDPSLNTRETLEAMTKAL